MSRLLFVMALAVAACADGGTDGTSTATTETQTVTDVSAVCLEAGVLSVEFNTCLSSSCDTVVSSSCEATGDASNLDLVASVVIESDIGGDCTDDCGAAIVECTLPAGVTLGSSVTVTGDLPGVVNDDVCLR